MSIAGVIWFVAVIVGLSTGIMIEMITKRSIGVLASIILGIAGALAITISYRALGIEISAWSHKVVVVALGSLLFVAAARLIIGQLETLWLTLGWKLKRPGRKSSQRDIQSGSY